MSHAAHPAPQDTPQALQVIFHNIPQQLKQAHRWLLWRYERTSTGRWRRTAYRTCGRRANAADPRSWSTFANVQAAYEAHLRQKAPYDGVAFVLGDGFAAVELDGVIDESDSLLEWAGRLCDDFRAYAESGPESFGLNLIVHNMAEGPNVEPIPHPEGGSIAVWRQNRFLCITGYRDTDDTTPHVEDRTAQLEHLIRQLGSLDVATALVGNAVPGIPSASATNTDPASTSNHAEPLATPLITSSHHPLISSPAPPLIDHRQAHEPSPSQRNSRGRPPAEKNVADQIVELALSEFRIGRTPAGEAFAVPLAGPDIAHMLRGGTNPLRNTLAARYHRRHGRTPTSSALTDALNVIQAEAAEKAPEPVHLRRLCSVCHGRCPCSEDRRAGTRG